VGKSGPNSLTVPDERNTLVVFLDFVELDFTDFSVHGNCAT
jgi:hypothetical protein